MGVLSLAIVAGFYWFGYRPKIETIYRLEEDIQLLERKIREAEVSLRGLEKLEKAHEERESVAGLMEEVLPSGGETAALLRELFVRSEGLDIEFISLGSPVFSPANSESGKVQKITLTLKLRSPFLKLVEYLNRLDSLRRMVSIIDLRIQTKEDILPKVEADLTLEAYAWVEEE